MIKKFKFEINNRKISQSSQRLRNLLNLVIGILKKKN